MVLNQDNEYTAVLDACVLVPMCLCDTLLRLAEEPAFYRPIWSEQILQEVGDALESKINLSAEQRQYRIAKMSESFPESAIHLPESFAESLTGIPDAADRHVLAAAIIGRANVIVTSNAKHFPDEYLASFDILRQSPDDFLIHQFHLDPYQILEKLSKQAIAIKKERKDVVESLKRMTPKFVELVTSFLIES